MPGRPSAGKPVNNEGGGGGGEDRKSWSGLGVLNFCQYVLPSLARSFNPRFMTSRRETSEPDDKNKEIKHYAPWQKRGSWLLDVGGREGGRVTIHLLVCGTARELPRYRHDNRTG